MSTWNRRNSWLTLPCLKVWGSLGQPPWHESTQQSLTMLWLQLNFFHTSRMLSQLCSIALLLMLLCFFTPILQIEQKDFSSKAKGLYFASATSVVKCSRTTQKQGGTAESIASDLEKPFQHFCSSAALKEELTSFDEKLLLNELENSERFFSEEMA